MQITIDIHYTKSIINKYRKQINSMRCSLVTVAILMSTYNGEKYLNDQIDSIMNQSYSDWHLYIRDDGSTDNTPSIIRMYEKKDARITFLNKNNIQNVGVTKSFLTLLQNVAADLYMFSDQDDVWKENKIMLSVNAIENGATPEQPACVFSELQVVDKKLHPLRLMNGNNVWFDFPHFLFGNCVTGCTMMINQALKSKLKLNLTNINHLYLHDWWIALIASSLGKLIYINEPTILYRQHGNNVEGSKKNNLFTLLTRLLNIHHEEDLLSKTLIMDKEFQKLFGDQLQGLNKQYLTEYVSLLASLTFGERLRLIYKFPPKRLHLKGKLLFGYIILFRYQSLRREVR